MRRRTQTPVDDIDTDTRASKATFELYEDSADEWRWRLVHDNSHVTADSGEGYASKQGATNGLESVKENVRVESSARVLVSIPNLDARAVSDVSTH